MSKQDPYHFHCDAPEFTRAIETGRRVIEKTSFAYKLGIESASAREKIGFWQSFDFIWRCYHNHNLELHTKKFLPSHEIEFCFCVHSQSIYTNANRYTTHVISFRWKISKQKQYFLLFSADVIWTVKQSHCFWDGQIEKKWNKNAA